MSVIRDDSEQRIVSPSGLTCFNNGAVFRLRRSDSAAHVQQRRHAIRLCRFHQHRTAFLPQKYIRVAKRDFAVIQRAGA